MAAANDKKGYRGCIIAILTLAIIISLSLLYSSMRTGGIGVGRQVAQKALKGVELSILQQLPADIGISQEEIKSGFEAAKKANQQGKVDLEKLKNALHKYQKAIGKSAPSAGQIKELLEDMNESIIASGEE